MSRLPPSTQRTYTLFPHTTLFRSSASRQLAHQSLDLGQRAEQLIERLGDEHLRRAFAQRTRQPQPQMAIGIEPQRERRLARRVAPDAPLALARGFAPDPDRKSTRLNSSH